MNIDLVKFFEEADRVYPFEGEVSTDSISNFGEFKIIEPIKYKGEIYKVDGSYLIKANIGYRYETKCDRCFETTIKQINTSLSARLEDYGKQYEDNEEDDDIIYYKKGILDLDEYILMEVASSLPMKSLCDEDCKGLCPKCGIDLNKESCNCEDDYIDPRFEKLKDLFVKK
ncbi:MAG: DUF177 domain-containing protein [Tissierellaceae bacterium]|nr:DUF177 domain-containing protein [Tissierellaceae bacterium]